MHIYTLLVSWDIYGIIRNFIFASKNIWDLFQVLQINNMLVLVYWNANMTFDWINAKMDNLLNHTLVHIVLNTAFNLSDMWGAPQR